MTEHELTALIAGSLLGGNYSANPNSIAVAVSTARRIIVAATPKQTVKEFTPVAPREPA